MIGRFLNCSHGHLHWRQAVEVNAVDYLEFPDEAVTGRADHRHRWLLRAQTLGPAGCYATENA